MNLPVVTITATDFFNQLLFDVEQPIDINENICLITNTPLDPSHVTLSCNHKFNYIPLIYDLQTNKIPRAKTEAVSFNCPYCRTPQTQYIPYSNTAPFIKGVHSKADSITVKASAKEAKAAEVKAAKEAKAAEVKAAKEAKAAEAKAAKEAKAAEAKAAKEAKAAEAKAAKEAKAAEVKAAKEAKAAEAKAAKEAKAAEVKAAKEAKAVKEV